MKLFPKCVWIFNHSWGKYGKPMNTYVGTIKQSRECLDCGKIQVRNIGYQDGLHADGVKLPDKDKQ